MFSAKNQLKLTDSNLFHSKSEKKALEELRSNIAGLSSEEAQNRLRQFGFNEILEKKPVLPIFLFLKQFHSILIYILVVAAIISYSFGKLIDVYVIAAVIFINAIIGFIQEHRAEQAIAALKKLIVPRAKVYRQGELQEINAKDLVPGDILLLEEGYRVPADARLLETKNFRAVEASLTGESMPVDKQIKPLSQNAVLADQTNMVWTSTFVANGQAKAIVTATGSQTAIGQIAQALKQVKREKGHFEQKTDVLAKQMGFIAIVSVSVVFLVGFFVRDFEFAQIFLFTIAALVSGIPAGLPAILTVVLAVGARRMAKRNAIVRSLPATETLGVADIIITDKTGTLTQNTMMVEQISVDRQSVFVSGSGWNPKGNFSVNNNLISPLERPALAKLLHIAAICNNARLIKTEGERGAEYTIIGDPTEAALVVLAEKAGLTPAFSSEYSLKIDELPFDQEYKYRAVMIKRQGIKDSKKEQVSSKIKEIYASGAPENILSRSRYILENNQKKKLTAADRSRLTSELEKMAEGALRILGLAYQEADNHVEFSHQTIDNLVFVGLVGMKDPPRLEAKEALTKAQKAGIRVIMTTGDYKGTAIAIAKEIGLIDKKTPHPLALTETELKKLSKNEFEKAIKNIAIFARVTPEMKMRIADVLQKQGHIVAMTGDGVNDSLALKKADIGIAMGVIGTDVARESSKMILADDNFASIVQAIKEGRVVFDNTRQASSFLVTTNFAEHATILTTLFIGLPLPLLPTQILWLNLVTDGVSGVPLALEPGHDDIFSEPPRKKRENVLSRDIIPFLILMVGIMAILTIAVFQTFLPISLEKARTGAFVVMAFTQLFNALNMRSLKRSLFQIGLLSNIYIVIGLLISLILQIIVLYTPFFQNIFQFVSLKPAEFIVIVAMSSLVLWLGELYKLVKPILRRKKSVAGTTENNTEG